MKPVKIIFFLCLLLTVSFVFSGCVKGSSDHESVFGQSGIIDTFIEETMTTDNIAGLAACIVKDGRVAWAAGYGYANIEKNIPVTGDTLFGLASISKTPTVTILMQLYEQGMFQLDHDVNDYLPFTVRNPEYPDIPITFRMLMTHTSSMEDNWAVMTYYSDRDSPIPLGEYIEAYVTPGSELYLPGTNFLFDVAPGEVWTYCNNAIVLVAYLAEVMAGIPFEQQCRDNIFTPLGMNHTTWFLAGTDRDTIAMPYKFEDGNQVPYGYYGYSDWPAGLLRSSVNELGVFLAAYIERGTTNNYTMLQPATVDLILSQQTPLNATQGLVWYTSNNRWAHAGGDLGVSTFMIFDPYDRVGVIVLSNSGGAGGSVSRITDKLFSHAGDL
ncbi:MAG: beta-lactamase family protein [bacterium]|nr:beta-lactamase family protein [bacterium]